VDKLEEVGATIGGIVLNRFDIKKAQGYDQYHYGYSSEYEAYQDLENA
jgi:Mrp family chromosome partitioning ATPase